MIQANGFWAETGKRTISLEFHFSAFSFVNQNINILQ